MASAIDLIQKSTPNDEIQASAVAMSATVAVTEKELITGKTGMFGFGGKVERFPLAELRDVRYTPNMHSDLLAVAFNGANQEVTLMFRPAAKHDAQRIAQLLQARLTRNGGDGR